MIRPQEIISMVGTVTGIDPHEIISPVRTKHIVAARQLAQYLCVQHAGMHPANLGKHFGGLDRTAILYSLDIVKNRIAKEPEFATTVAALEQSIGYRQTAAAATGTDLLDLARQIVLNPRRAAIGASIYEISALASLLLDLWDAATTSEALIGMIAGIEFSATDSEGQDRIRAMQALANSILETMAAARGAPAEEAMS